MHFGILCILLWGLIPLVTALGMTGLDQYQFLFWSSLLSFLTLLLVTTASKQLTPIKLLSVKNLLYLIVLGLLGTFFYYLCLYQGYKFGSKIEVLSVQYTWPAWVIAFSLMVNKQALRWHHLLIIASGICAVLLVITKGELTQLVLPNLSVLLWVLAGATGFALFSVLSGRVNMPSLPLNTLFFAVATIASLILMLAKSSFALPNIHNLLPVLVNGVLVNGISYYFWVLALRSTKAEHLSLLTFVTPLISVMYLMIFANEPFLPIYLLAFGLITASGVTSVLASSRQIE